ncbi:MAG TPA: lysylphosphatidylglycerol synthase transmembrane domain-containing protein [Anaerolineae bacterium]
MSQPLLERSDSGSSGATWRSRLLLLLRILVALVLIIIIFRVIDFSSVGNTIAKADLRWGVLILVLALADRYIMACKWAGLLRAQGTVFSDWEAFKVYMSSTFIGTVLPTSVGSDVYRAVRAKLAGHQMNVITASIVLERVLGMLAVTLLSLCGLAAISGKPNTHFGTLLGAVAILTAALLIAIRLSIDPKMYALITQFFDRFRHLKPVRIFMDLHSAYMTFSRSRVVFGSFFALTFLEQMLNALLTYLGSLALGLNTPYIFYLALVPLSRFVTLLPISLGGIGVTEGAYVFALSLAGISAVDALSLAVLMRLIGWAMLVPEGLFFFYDSVKLKQAKREERTVPR